MTERITGEAWAQAVKASYDRQVEEGISPPLLPEAILWAAPGGDCLRLLRTMGLETIPQPGGVIIRAIGIAAEQTNPM